MTDPLQSERSPFLSVVVPVYNERDNLTPLHQRLTAALTGYGKSYELLLIDDGSTDGSWEGLRALHESDPHVRVLRFARNFGQQMAVSAGLRAARGSVVVLLDADLQAAPEEIPKLVDKLGEGFDIVYGLRERRQDPWWRRLGSVAMSKLLYRVVGIDVPDSVSGFIALSRQFVETINLFNEKTKYLSGLLAWLSYGRSATVPVSHSARQQGHSKYNLWKLVSLTLTFVCNYSVAPLRLGLVLGLAVLGLSLLGFVMLLVGLTLDTALNKILIALGVFSGVQLVCVGILGEYLGRIYREVRQQPAFVVREVLDHEPLNR